MFCHKDSQCIHPVDERKGEMRSKIGGFIPIPVLEEDGKGDLIFERSGPALPNSQVTRAEDEGPGEIWFISTPEDRAYHNEYLEKKRAHRIAQSEANARERREGVATVRQAHDNGN